MKAENLINKVFGHLTVIQRDCSKMSRPYWICKCDCENHTIISVRADKLKSGLTKSCGCYQKQRASQANIKDLTGKEYGKLKVIDFKEIKNHRAYWNCKCSCGNEICVSTSALTTGNTKSCGCIKSYGEQQLIKILEQLNINYEYQYSFKDLKHKKRLCYDFYLLDKNILIEYQGIQHFEPIDYFGGEERFSYQKKLDELKRDYAKRKHIQLIEIPYTVKLTKEYLEEILNDNRII